MKLGIAMAGVRKANRKDLTVVLLDEGAAVAGVFTQNRFCAAPPSPLEKREKLEQLRAMELGMQIWARVIDEAPLSVDNPADLEAARATAAATSVTAFSACRKEP